MSTKFEEKVIYTTGNTYPELVDFYLKGYTIVHYYKDAYSIDVYVKKLEQYLQRKNETVFIQPIVRTEKFSREHRFHTRYQNELDYGETIYQVIVSAVHSLSNQDALFALHKEEVQ